MNDSQHYDSQFSIAEQAFEGKVKELLTVTELANSYGMTLIEFFVCVERKILIDPNPPSSVTYSAVRGKLWRKADFDKWFGSSFLSKFLIW